MTFLHQIIDLPPSAWRVIETPSLAERLTLALIRLLLLLLSLYSKTRLIIRSFARAQCDRCRLAAAILTVSLTVIFEDALITAIGALMPRLAPA